MKTAVLFLFCAVAGSAQITAQPSVENVPPGSLFWVTSTASANGSAAIPAFDFHWSSGSGSAPDRLQSYVVVVHYYQGPVGNDYVDTNHWLGFVLPGTAKLLPESDEAGASFGPGAGTGPFNHYSFDFYALNTAPAWPGDVSIREFQRMLAGNIIAHTKWLEVFRAR